MRTPTQTPSIVRGVSAEALCETVHKPFPRKRQRPDLLTVRPRRHDRKVGGHADQEAERSISTRHRGPEARASRQPRTWLQNAASRPGSAASMTSSLMRHAMPVSVGRQPGSRSPATWRAARYVIAPCPPVPGPARHSAHAKKEPGADLRSAGRTGGLRAWVRVRPERGAPDAAGTGGPQARRWPARRARGPVPIPGARPSSPRATARHDGLCSVTDGSGAPVEGRELLGRGAAHLVPDRPVAGDGQAGRAGSARVDVGDQLSGG
jgi:hypothetical protein